MNATQKKESKQILHIFLSYDATDEIYARKLRKLLSQRPDLRVFTMDKLSAGEDWQSRLRDELDQSDIFIVLLSTSSIISELRLQEIGAAWALNKRIIPIATHPDAFSEFPYFNLVALKDVKFIEMKDLEKPEVINRILDPYGKLAS